MTSTAWVILLKVLLVWFACSVAITALWGLVASTVRPKATPAQQRVR